MTQMPISIDGGPAPRGPMRADLITARQVAELLGVPLSTVHEWERRGELRRVKLGRHVRFLRAHVERAILGHEQ
jgi:excisionase family DNA binding protein